MKTFKITIILYLFCTLGTYANHIGLETMVPTGWSSSKGTISISADVYKRGTQSLKWDWVKGDELNIENPRGMTTAVNLKNGGMMLWIYNDKAIDSKIMFKFYKGTVLKYFFNYNINFKGWRACWIRFTEDMMGPLKDKDIDRLQIVAPEDKNSGRLYLDRMSFPTKRIAERLTPDAQLPFINPWMNSNHWGALYHWESEYVHDIAIEDITTEQISQIATIEANMRSMYKVSKPSTSAVSKYKLAYDALKISRTGDYIKGLPFIHSDVKISGESYATFSTVGPVLKNLARTHYYYKDSESLEMFCNTMDYVIDQGLAFGSGLGTNHHYGYSFREYPEALFIMKDALKDDPRMDGYLKMIKYWSGVQEFRENPEVGSLQGLIDNWNTTLLVRMMAILSMPNTSTKVQELRAMKRWTDGSLEIVPGSMGGIKPDGTGFHHYGLYPAYCNGGYTSLGKYIHILGDSEFQTSDRARLNLGNALTSMMLYTNGYDWGTGLSGRHPLYGSMSNGVVSAMAYVALIGQPYGNEPVWRELAGHCLRLSKYSSIKRLLTDKGASVIEKPQGFYSFNYGALGMYHKNDNSVTMKGYNDFVWSSEIYYSDNRFGRYQSYGSVQIMKNDAVASGFDENGWDWNRVQGATTIHLPLSKLESPYSWSLMEKDPLGFSGSSTLGDESGVFVFDLHERNRVNFTGDFRAKKSVFCFDSLMICLGSNISNSNGSYNTETNLFQYSITGNTNREVYINSTTAVSEFPYTYSDNDGDAWLLDPMGNGYYVKSGSSVQLRKQNQESQHNKTEKTTYGDFAVAWLDHGSSPSNIEYEYVVMLDSDASKMHKFATQMRSGENLPYRVIQKNSDAHIVEYLRNHTIAYSIFNATSFAGTDLKSVNHSSLVMMKKIDSQSFQMSVCDPDLHISSGNPSNASQQVAIIAVVKGKWRLSASYSDCKVVSADVDSTVLEFQCVDGLPVEVVLTNRTRQNQEITWVSRNTKMYGDGSYRLTAVASSGLPVSYVSSDSNVAKIVDGSVLIKGVGQARITATQDGANVWNAAPSYYHYLQVNKRELSVGVENVERAYGESTPEFNVVCSGFAEGENLGNSGIQGSAVASTNDELYSPAGSRFTITTSLGTLESDNYSFIFTNGELLIVKAEPYINFSTIPVLSLDEKEFVLSAETNAQNEISYSSSNRDVAIVDNGILQLLGVGETSVKASIAEGDNYLFYEKSQNVIINLASAIGDEYRDEVSFKPNPVVSTVEITGVDMTNISKAFVVSASGGQIAMKISELLSGAINLSILKSGVYLFVIETKNGTMIKRKFIKT